jgi:hypothetical protein
VVTDVSEEGIASIFKVEFRTRPECGSDMFLRNDVPTQKIVTVICEATSTHEVF